MTLLLINNTVGRITVNDLGIELETIESMSLTDAFTAQNILDSLDLKTEMESNPDIILTLDDEEIPYAKAMEYLTSLTVYSHEKVDTFKHLISEGSYFKTQKLDGKTKLITYYSDNTMTKIILEEEIVRGTDGRVSMIKKRHHDYDGLLVKEEHQTFNRIDGRVDSVDMEVIL